MQQKAATKHMESEDMPQFLKCPNKDKWCSKPKIKAPEAI